MMGMLDIRAIQRIGVSSEAVEVLEVFMNLLQIIWAGIFHKYPLSCSDPNRLYLVKPPGK